MSCGIAAAGPEEIVSVLISRTGGTADMEIRFACPHRLLGMSPADATTVSEITLVRTDRCPGADDSIRDATRPAGRELAALDEVEYTARPGTSAALRLRFDRPVIVAADQSGDLRGLHVRVEVVAGASADAAAALPVPAVQSPPSRLGPTPEQIARAEERARLASQPKPAAAAVAPGFVLNLRSAIAPIDIGAESAGLARRDQTLYVSDLQVDDQLWHRLRLGFFATEAEADAALAGLRSRYPDAWVTQASAAERLASGAATTAPQGPMPATAGPVAGPLRDGQAAELLGQARGAIIDQDYQRAIDATTLILAAPPLPETAEAREILGLARERSGQVTQAVAEYQRYLAEYPDGDGALRVRQRLAALTTAREQPKESIRGQAAARDSAWDVYGGISQFYRRDSIDFGGESGSVDQAALFSDAELVARHTGERFDFESRATVGYTWDMSGGDDNPDNETRIYNLYVDLNDQSLGVSTRLGRQTLRNQGVLGRFDGGIVSWQVAPSYRLNVLAGLPVYNPNETVEASRTFYGFSVDALNLLDLFDVNVFMNIQEVDDVNDREATGVEVRYFGGNRALIASVDYDFGYSELNSVAALGNWTFDNSLTVNGRFDWRNSPYLTTENALIGQPASSIQDLLLTYTEGEIRQLALDRSGAMQSFALGVSRPISERFQISADVTASQYDGTPDSGGVRETPDSGTLIYSYLSLIGTSLIREGDISVLSLRYSDSGASKSTAVFLDTRYPVSQALRLNPRVLVSYRDIIAGDATELLVRPGLRMLYRMTRQFRLEFEGGGEFGTRDSGDESNNSTGYYLYMGYSADF
jgi:tetratricopeptide (TPR) repeat protein